MQDAASTETDLTTELTVFVRVGMMGWNWRYSIKLSKLFVATNNVYDFVDNGYKFSNALTESYSSISVLMVIFTYLVDKCKLVLSRSLFAFDQHLISTMSGSSNSACKPRFMRLRHTSRIYFLKMFSVICWNLQARHLGYCLLTTRVGRHGGVYTQLGRRGVWNSSISILETCRSFHIVIGIAQTLLALMSM